MYAVNPQNSGVRGGAVALPRRCYFACYFALIHCPLVALLSLKSWQHLFQSIGYLDGTGWYNKTIRIFMINIL